MEHTPHRDTFLSLAALFEGGLVVVALLIGWGFDVDPLERFAWEWSAVGWGLAGVVPLYSTFLLFARFPVGPLGEIKQLLLELLGPILVNCRKTEMAVIALLAGLGEEVLFRGLLLPLTGGDSFYFGLIWSSLLFGLAHAITPTYVVLAAIAGAYLAVQWQLTDNLLVPIITHAVYDYLAFVKLSSLYRLSSETNRDSEAEI